MYISIMDSILKKEIAEQTISFINTQLGIISDSLEVAAKNLESFRMANKFFDFKNENTILTKQTRKKR